MPVAGSLPYINHKLDTLFNIKVIAFYLWHLGSFPNSNGALSVNLFKSRCDGFLIDVA